MYSLVSPPTFPTPPLTLSTLCPPSVLRTISSASRFMTGKPGVPFSSVLAIPGKSVSGDEMRKERAIGRLGAVDVGRDRLVIRLPDPKLLRLLARSVLLALVIMPFPWIQAALLRRSATEESVAPFAAVPPIDDEGFVLPMLLGDLRLRGLLRPEDRAVFLGDPGVQLPYLMQNGVAPISHDRMPAVPDGSVDFAISADEVLASAGRDGFDFIDRALKIDGVAAFRVSSDPLEPFHLPENYQMAYIRRIGAATMVAMRKKSAAATAEASTGEALAVQHRRGRRLLAVPDAKEEALNGRPLRPRYLLELTGYPRRVFVDVGLAGANAGTAAAWFERHSPEAAGAGAGGMEEWLEKNVRGEAVRQWFEWSILEFFPSKGREFE